MVASIAGLTKAFRAQAFSSFVDRQSYELLTAFYVVFLATDRTLNISIVTTVGCKITVLHCFAASLDFHEMLYRELKPLYRKPGRLPFQMPVKQRRLAVEIVEFLRVDASGVRVQAICFADKLGVFELWFVGLVRD